MNKSAICFLSRSPNTYLIDFVEELKKDNFADIYIMCDDNNKKITQDYIIQIEDKISFKRGFYNTTWFGRPCSWDKSLYYFCIEKKDYDFVWFIEDDVFIPSVEAIKNFHEKYINSDLVCQSNGCNATGDISEWHWRKAVSYFRSLPWYCSMTCMIGVSRKLLNIIRKYVYYRKRLAFQEIMFNTLAMRAKLIVSTPPELSTIAYRHQWSFDDVERRPNNFFHPVKHFSDHELFRNKLKDK